MKEPARTVAMPKTPMGKTRMDCDREYEMRARLDAAMSYISDGFFILDNEWNVFYANRPILCHPLVPDFVGKNILRDFPKSGPLLRGLLRAKRSGNRVRCAAHIEYADIWLEMNVHPLPDGELAVYVRDITEEKKRQALLEEKFARAFQSGSVLMAISTLEEGRFVDVNRIFLDVLGYSRAEVVGKTSQDLKLFANPEDRERILSLFKELGRVINFALDIRDKAGNLHAGLFSVEGIQTHDQGRLLMTSLVDITREKRLQETLEETNRALQRKADIDGLTGLYNHAFLIDALEKEIERSRRYGGALSVVMIDIDHFKKFNDSYGHQVGDAVLKEVAGLLQAGSRTIDVAGRYGGEEFMLVLPNTKSTGAYEVAERIRRKIAASEFTPAGRKITISAGVAEFGGQKLDALIHEADERMYAAKRHGRDRVEV